MTNLSRGKGARFEQLRDEHCKLCGSSFGKGSQRLQIHHIDQNRANNKPANLLIVCRKCHTLLHYEKSWYVGAAKHMRHEGYSLQAIADTFGVSRQRIHQLLKQEKIAEKRRNNELERDTLAQKRANGRQL